MNFHLDAMKKMGVAVDVEEGYIKARVKGTIRGAHIVFPQVTVTGTENLLILGACAEGPTTIENAAREPEVTALGEVLRACGAEISGLGTSTIEVTGNRLTPPKKPVVIPPDRIETGTWISAAVATRSELTIVDADAGKLGAVIEAFRSMGARIDVSKEGSIIKVEPCDVLSPIEVETQPYPGFATDMQAQMLTNMCLANGTSTMCETIFENRFMHVAELQRLGAKISVQGNLAVVKGPVTLQAAPIMATDLRASACLVIAGLCAEGRTKVTRIYHLDRGYQRLDEKLLGWE